MRRERLRHLRGLSEFFGMKCCKFESKTSDLDQVEFRFRWCKGRDSDSVTWTWMTDYGHIDQQQRMWNLSDLEGVIAHLRIKHSMSDWEKKLVVNCNAELKSHACRTDSDSCSCCTARGDTPALPCLSHINCTILSLLTSRLAMDTANEVPDKLYSALWEGLKHSDFIEHCLS